MENSAALHLFLVFLSPLLQIQGECPDSERIHAQLINYTDLSLLWTWALQYLHQVRDKTVVRCQASFLAAEELLYLPACALVIVADAPEWIQLGGIQIRSSTTLLSKLLVMLAVLLYSGDAEPVGSPLATQTIQETAEEFLRASQHTCGYLQNVTRIQNLSVYIEYCLFLPQARQENNCLFNTYFLQ